MTVKRFSLRFNLDREDERKAWDAIHRTDARTVNKEIISRINAKEQTKALEDLIRRVIAEELAKNSGGMSVLQPTQSENGTEEIEDVFSFLDSF